MRPSLCVLSCLIFQTTWESCLLPYLPLALSGKAQVLEGKPPTTTIFGRQVDQLPPLPFTLLIMSPHFTSRYPPSPPLT